MSSLPDSVQARLQELAQKFSSALPDVIREVRALADQASVGRRESLRELRLRVHRIAGSAATFGFEEIGLRARAAENEIERDLATESPGPSERTTAALQELYRAAANPMTADQASSAAPRATTVEPPGYDRVLILVGDVPGLPEDFGEQVAVFRFAVSFAEDILSLPDFCSVQLGQEDSPYRHAVIMADAGHFSRQPARLRVLKSLRQEYREKLVLFLVGQEDDFETRLRSVRFGADAFISTPVDLSRFVDHIESFTGENREGPVHVLIIDDDPEQVSSTALVLQDAGMITSVVTDPSHIFQVLVEYRPELILLDMYMPGCSGPELAKLIRQNENFVGIPILYLSVEKDVEKQLEAIEAGGDGFLEKPIHPDHLVAMVRTLANRTRSMRYYMERDSLTGLLNHTNLKQQLENELQRARRMGIELVFAMIDLDRFKSVNDTYGHLTGDRVIKSLARLLSERLRRSDTIGRYGGEEFGVILFNTDAAQAHRILDEIRESFSSLRQTDGQQEFTVTLSCGLAEFPRFETAVEMGEAADAALYSAKENGRNRIVIAPVGDDLAP